MKEIILKTLIEARSYEILF